LQAAVSVAVLLVPSVKRNVPLNFSLPPEQPLMPMYGRPLAVPETEVEKFSSVAVTPASGVTMLAGNRDDELVAVVPGRLRQRGGDDRVDDQRRGALDVQVEPAVGRVGLRRRTVVRGHGQVLLTADGRLAGGLAAADLVARALALDLRADRRGRVAGLALLEGLGVEDEVLVEEIVALVVAKVPAGLPAPGVVVVSTLSLPIDFGLAFVPALLL